MEEQEVGEQGSSDSDFTIDWEMEPEQMEEAEMEQCEATQCNQAGPWVQCGRCERWLHMDCTGLRQQQKELLKQGEDNEQIVFNCGVCGKEELEDNRYSQLSPKVKKRRKAEARAKEKKRIPGGEEKGKRKN